MHEDPTGILRVGATLRFNHCIFFMFSILGLEVKENLYNSICLPEI